MKTTHIGPELADGRRPVSIYRGPKQGWVPSGYLMPQASQRTLEASPGIQSWSHPRGKTSTELYDGGATILSFSDYCKRHLIPTYPHTRR